MTYDEQLYLLIKNALAEDIGPGDYSTLSTIDAAAHGKAVLAKRHFSRYAGSRKNF